MLIGNAPQNPFAMENRGSFPAFPNAPNQQSFANAQSSAFAPSAAFAASTSFAPPSAFATSSAFAPFAPFTPSAAFAQSSASGQSAAFAPSSAFGQSTTFQHQRPFSFGDTSTSLPTQSAHPVQHSHPRVGGQREAKLFGSESTSVYPRQRCAASASWLGHNVQSSEQKVQSASAFSLIPSPWESTLPVGDPAMVDLVCGKDSNANVGLKQTQFEQPAQTTSGFSLVSSTQKPAAPLEDTQMADSTCQGDSNANTNVIQSKSRDSHGPVSTPIVAPQANALPPFAVGRQQQALPPASHSLFGRGQQSADQKSEIRTSSSLSLLGSQSDFALTNSFSASDSNTIFGGGPLKLSSRDATFSMSLAPDGNGLQNGNVATSRSDNNYSTNFQSLGNSDLLSGISNSTIDFSNRELTFGAWGSSGDAGDGGNGGAVLNVDGSSNVPFIEDNSQSQEIPDPHTDDRASSSAPTCVFMRQGVCSYGAGCLFCDPGTSIGIS